MVSIRVLCKFNASSRPSMKRALVYEKENPSQLKHEEYNMGGTYGLFSTRWDRFLYIIFHIKLYISANVFEAIKYAFYAPIHLWRSLYFSLQILRINNKIFNRKCDVITLHPHPTTIYSYAGPSRLWKLYFSTIAIHFCIRYIFSQLARVLNVTNLS